jgi:galactokinase
MDAVLRAAVDGFRRTHGTNPDALFSAPGRVNLIGEHTDYNGGFVMPFGIDRRTAMAVRMRNDRLVRFTTSLPGGATSTVEGHLDSLAPTGLADWGAYVLGTIWAASTMTELPADARGFDAVLASTVPIGAGLSSSAAVESVVAIAIDELWGLGLSRLQLATIGRKAENDAVGAPTGIMDQVAVLFARADAAVFLDCRDLVVESVDLGLAPAGITVLVVDTRESHAHATGGYAARRASCEAAAAALGVPSLREATLPALLAAGLPDETMHRARHVITENDRVLDAVTAMRARDLPRVGELMLESHASMRDDFEISTPALDLAVQTLMAAGALGARMTGGGFGGAAIGLVAIDSVATTTVAVTTAFADAGFGAPSVFTVHPSDGARREDLP